VKATTRPGAIVGAAARRAYRRAAMSPADAFRTDLSGRGAIVTGAASGIGAAIGTALAAAGAATLLVDRDDGGLERTRAAIEDAGGRCATLAVDVTDDDAPARIIDTALERHGSLEILVHAAGIFETYTIAAFPREAFDRVFAINVRAPFLITQAAIPHLRAGASIIVIASGSARIPSPLGSVYGASKGALVTLTRAFAAELAPRGVRANAISPGPIDTPLLATALADPEVRRGMEAALPTGRLGRADEVAAVAVFQASDAASNMHGANVAVDGATTAGWGVTAEGNPSG
jgi:NAD(P)-dependent dehydrogenase (short-subunit alcohol dehydrogenase family)